MLDWDHAAVTRVKICGIKRLEDAERAIEYGADALGFLVGRRYASSDFISADAAASMIRSLPPFVTTVLVTHVVEAEEICGLATQLGCTAVQLHGDIARDAAAQIREQLPYVKMCKALHVTDSATTQSVQEWRGVVDAIVLDTAAPELDQIGGTGRTHDWTISATIVRQCPLPVILAGGLTAENVQGAIRQVRPYAVDVNSGTKDADGFKDPDKLRRFIRAAKPEGGALSRKLFVEQTS